jgi:hypothetical protein
LRYRVAFLLPPNKVVVQGIAPKRKESVFAAIKPQKSVLMTIMPEA